MVQQRIIIAATVLLFAGGSAFLALALIGNKWVRADFKPASETAFSFDIGLWEICLEFKDDQYFGDCDCKIWSDARKDFGDECPGGLDDIEEDGKAKVPPVEIIYARLMTCLSVVFVFLTIIFLLFTIFFKNRRRLFKIITGVLLFAAGASAIGSSVYFEEEFATGDFYGSDDYSWTLERDWIFQMIAGILLVFSAISFLLIKFKRRAGQSTAAESQPASSSAGVQSKVGGAGKPTRAVSMAYSQKTMGGGDSRPPPSSRSAQYQYSRQMSNNVPQPSTPQAYPPGAQAHYSDNPFRH